MDIGDDWYIRSLYESSKRYYLFLALQEVCISSGILLRVESFVDCSN